MAPSEEGVSLDLGSLRVSAGMRSRYVRGSKLILPWEIALALADADDADDAQTKRLLATLPAWCSDEDRIELTEPVRDALPPRSRWRLEVDHRGVYGRAGSDLVLRWVDGEGLSVEVEVEAPGRVRRKGREFRMTLSQHRVSAANRRILPMGGDRERDLAAVHAVLAGRVEGDESVLLGPGLRNERVRVVEGVRPQFVPAAADREAYRVVPQVDGVPDDELWQHVRSQAGDRLGRGLSLRTGAGDSTRVRVVFTEQARAALADAKAASGQVLEPEDVARILTAPEQHLPPSFDLSGLSDRVVGLGPVVLEPQIARSEAAVGGWFDWNGQVDLEALEGDASGRLDLRDAAVLAQVEDSIARADRAGAAYIANPVGRGLIALTQRFREAVLHARLRIEAAAEGRSADPKQGLLVRDNAIEVDYGAEDSLPGAGPRPRDIQPPPGLVSGHRLLEHQLIGLAWLRGHMDLAQRHGSHGALLADDMGLGKTLQVLSLWSDLLERGDRGPHLVVAPVALLENWLREAWTFFGDRLQPTHLFQSDSATDVAPERTAAQLRGQRVVFVSYETLRRHEFAFAKVKWTTVILDEAQKAKNPTTQIARVVRTLQAKLRLAVTGTPVENSLQDLWTLYDWATPGLLGARRAFTRHYVDPVAAGIPDPARAALAEELTGRIAPVFLRRLKQAVIKDLPPITVHDHRVPLSPAQERAYGAIITAVRRGAQPALGALPRLFGVCAHPELSLDRDVLTPASKLDFAKSARLWDILDGVARAGEKALVFAHRKTIQRWLADGIRERYGVPSPRIINGDMNGSTRRLGAIDAFSDRPGFDVLILAPRAAGVGLNIVAANHVVHYMREWNPAIENQATDRCYRIGQTRPVHVHTLTTTSPHGETVEGRLAELLASKRRLIAEFAIPMGDFEVREADFALDDGWAESQAGDGRGFDEDLFDPSIRPLLDVLASTPGVRVEPPEEHLADGRVIGLDDGTVVGPTGRAVTLLRSGGLDTGRIARHLEARQHACVECHPDKVARDARRVLEALGLRP